MKLRRIVAATALAALSSPVALMVFAAPVGALDQSAKAFVIHKSETITKTFGPMGAGNPSGSLHSPSRCNTLSTCDRIPLTVVTPPDLTDDDEYFVTVNLEWNTASVPAAGTVNDLDLYIYQNQTAADGTKSDVVVGSSASSSEPEKAVLFRPAGDYNIVVNDFNGANTDGYKLTVAYVNEVFGSPFEAVTEKPRPPANSASSDAGVSAPPDTSGDAFVPPPVSSSGDFGLLEPLPVTVDSDLLGIGNSSQTGTEESAAGAGLDRVATKVRPAKPVAGIIAFLWMVVLPGALIAGAAMLLARRRPAALVTG